MSNFSEYFGGTGGGGNIGGWSMPVLVSKSLPAFTKAGQLEIMGMGAGGSAAVQAASGNQGATGGNSAPWGIKVIPITPGDVISVAIGTSTKPIADNSDGVQGGATTIFKNGSAILTCQGGEGGKNATTTGVINANPTTATVIGADWSVSGIPAGSLNVAGANQTFRTGGAAVDILQTGLGRSPSALSNGAVSDGGCVGNDTASPPKPWILFLKFGLSLTSGMNAGDPGRGAKQASSSLLAGDFAGGAASASGVTTIVPASNGGLGAGGGAGQTIAASGFGGNGYAYLSFFPG